MQSVQTRFIGPTNTKGARIRAFSEGFKRGIVTPYNYGGEQGEHDWAATVFITHREWFGVWARGGAADGRGNVYVWIRETPTTGDRYNPDLMVVMKVGGAK